MVPRQAQGERSFDLAQDERLAEEDPGLRPGRRDRVWTPALGEAFLRLVRETGNARAAARALGHPNLFNNRMKRHPEFKRRARAGAEARTSRKGAKSDDIVNFVNFTSGKTPSLRQTAAAGGRAPGAGAGR